MQPRLHTCGIELARASDRPDYEAEGWLQTRQRSREENAMKIILWIVGILLLIGLLVVFGVLDLIF
jgi:hypothetical protein